MLARMPWLSRLARRSLTSKNLLSSLCSGLIYCVAIVGPDGQVNDCRLHTVRVARHVPDKHAFLVVHNYF